MERKRRIYIDPPESVSFIVPAQSDFDPVAHFVRDTKDSARVKIAYLSEEFLLLLSSLEEKEGHVGEMTLIARTLTDKLITEEDKVELIERGGEEISLSQLWFILKLQGDGQDGDQLLVNGNANLFSVLNSKGRSRVVSTSWNKSACGWMLDAHVPWGAFNWFKTMRVFSRS